MDSSGVHLSRVFLEFSPRPDYSIMVAEKFQIYSVKTSVNTFVSQKNESVLGIAHSSRTAFSEDIFS